MATYVVVHGAWGGAWSWNRMIVPRLRAAGHTVYAPTLTGLGERTHLAAPTVDLSTHVSDVENVLFYEDLRDVVLVGHSYGGMVITGAADRQRERIRHLAYLDAFVPTDGQSLFDLIGPEGTAQMRALAVAEGDGWRVPPRPLPPDTPAELLSWIMERRGQQPISTFAQALRFVNGPIELPRTYVYCSEKAPGHDAFAAIAARVKADAGWRYHEIATDHNLQYSAVAETVMLLLELA